MTYPLAKYRRDKPLVWLHGEIYTPPFSEEARIEAGTLLRRLQRGDSLGLPHSRPMPVIGRNCHELRITDRDAHWRIFYHINSESIVILGVFDKDTRSTTTVTINTCKQRLKRYLETLK